MSASSTFVQSLIDRWPSLGEFAADLGVEYGTAKQMRRRSSISSAHWTKVIDGAINRGITGVTYEALARAHAPKVAA